MARSAANQAVRDKERALHEKGIQEQKAAFLEAEVSRTSTALQQERRSHAAEVCAEAHVARQAATVRAVTMLAVAGVFVCTVGAFSLLLTSNAGCCLPNRHAAQLRELQVKLHDAEATAAEKGAAATRAAEQAEAQEAAAAELLQELKQTKQDAAEMREALERELDTTSRLVRHQLTYSLAAYEDPSLLVPCPLLVF